jgi:hypothetical protein
MKPPFLVTMRLAQLWTTHTQDNFAALQLRQTIRKINADMAYEVLNCGVLGSYLFKSSTGVVLVTLSALPVRDLPPGKHTTEMRQRPRWRSALRFGNDLMRGNARYARCTLLDFLYRFRSSMTEETAQISSTLLLFAALVVPWVTRRWPLWARATWRLAGFVVLTYLVFRTAGSPFTPSFDTQQSGERLWKQLIEIGWWLMAAQCAIGLARLLVVFETKPRESRIVSDLLAGLIHLLTLFAVINFVFAVPIGGLLATSGVIAIVLGLALQSSLSDVFSGIAVGIERPYSPGDLVWSRAGSRAG